MKLIRKSETNIVSNSNVVIMEEYLHRDPDLNLAIGTISGKYPDIGFVVNEISKEIVYVLEGEVKLILRNETVMLSTGDSVIIDQNEEFAWNGRGKVLTVCHPAWAPDQHKEVI